MMSNSVVQFCRLIFKQQLALKKILITKLNCYFQSFRDWSGTGWCPSNATAFAKSIWWTFRSCCNRRENICKFTALTATVGVYSHSKLTEISFYLHNPVLLSNTYITPFYVHPPSDTSLFGLRELILLVKIYFTNYPIPFLQCSLQDSLFSDIEIRRSL